VFRDAQTKLDRREQARIATTRADFAGDSNMTLAITAENQGVHVDTIKRTFRHQGIEPPWDWARSSKH